MLSPRVADADLCLPRFCGAVEAAAFQHPASPAHRMPGDSAEHGRLKVRRRRERHDGLADRQRGNSFL